MVERLKKFMEIRRLLASQFADSVGIPRSSFSQLTSGRNKTINSDTLVKIHKAYPELSLDWLLFGEGPMLVGQSAATPAPPADQSPAAGFHQSQLFFDDNNDTSVGLDLPLGVEPASTQPATPSAVDAPMSRQQSAVPLPAQSSSSRRIAKIIVFYDDNTFETFTGV